MSTKVRLRAVTDAQQMLRKDGLVGASQTLPDDLTTTFWVFGDGGRQTRRVEKHTPGTPVGKRRCMEGDPPGTGDVSSRRCRGRQEPCSKDPWQVLRQCRGGQHTHRGSHPKTAGPGKDFKGAI